ncbi:histone-lysine N-methyltransferase SUV39H1-like isoform 1-T1 [Synchiropus picturatus]
MAEFLKGCAVPCKMSFETLESVCRQKGYMCEELGVTRANINEYEVEFLCDYKKVNVCFMSSTWDLFVKAIYLRTCNSDLKLFQDDELYLVKWRGFPESVNTWEPKRNLKCSKLMKQFHQDLDHILQLKKRRRSIPKKLSKDISSILVQKARLRVSLQQWEAHLNHSRNHPGNIFVINEVDYEGPPKDFTYINNYKVSNGIVLNGISVGCECTNCLKEPVNGCCPGASQHRMAYNDKGQVRPRPGQPIYECNSECRCDASCPNRVVQNGIQFDLCIFKTDNGRGWGVRTLQHIRKNTFVMEYVGEIITSDEAERRGHVYDKQGSTYLFDLDYVEDVYTVDAAHQGNISHFVNHSCNPNLQVFNVFIDNIDERLPRIALFSTRAIRAGEELTFDYKMQIDPVDTESTKMDSSFILGGLPGSPKKKGRVECRCGSQTCRKYLF